MISRHPIGFRHSSLRGFLILRGRKIAERAGIKNNSVMPGPRVRPSAGPRAALVPGIHVFRVWLISKAWMAGTSPAMTKQEASPMQKRLLAAISLSFFLFTPAFAAQCGGDFNSFVGQMAREAQAAGISSAVVNSAPRRRHPRPGSHQFRSPPARHVPEKLRGLCAHARYRRPHRRREEAAAAARGVALPHRAALRRAAADRGRDLGPRDRFRHRRHGQAPGGENARDACA